MITTFNFQPVLNGENISIRALVESDFDDLYFCASDKKLWEGHPAKDQYKVTEFKKWFKSAIESGATIVIVDKLTNKLIGSSRFYIEDSEPNDISIGYTFIARQYWGGKINYELKKLMLAHAFKYFNTVWFHIAPPNIRSQKATQKIGGVFSHEANSNISGKSEPWMFYQIEKENWLR
mgnify:CR=1 FL=1